MPSLLSTDLFLSRPCYIVNIVYCRFFDKSFRVAIQDGTDHDYNIRVGCCSPVTLAKARIYSNNTYYCGNSKTLWSILATLRRSMATLQNITMQVLWPACAEHID